MSRIPKAKKAVPSKGPKARVEKSFTDHWAPGNPMYYWNAVLPCRGRKQAAALVRFHNLSYAEKVERAAKAMNGPVKVGMFTYKHIKDELSNAYARAALAAIGITEDKP